MKLQVQIEGIMRSVEIEPHGDGEFRALLDGTGPAARAIETGAGTLVILLADRAFDARVSQEGGNLLVRCAGWEFRVQIRDPRAWRAGNRTALEAAGPQRVVAPMPGKVVRVLVSAGQAVEAGQGLVVVEAMKMQNEVRAPKSGHVERVLVSEGQAVRTQEALLVIS
jgi:biotin carboxyl carrier protein